MDRVKVFLFAILPCLLVLALVPVIALDKSHVKAEGIDFYDIESSSGSFIVEPRYYEYEGKGWCDFPFTFTNKENKVIWIDMGNGDLLTVPALGEASYTYRLQVDGSPIKLYVTKMYGAEGMMTVQIRAVLKIVPKGGD